MRFQESVKILTFDLNGEKDFPYKCFEENLVIDRVIAMREFRKVRNFSCIKEDCVPLPTLEWFCKLAQEYSSLVYVMDDLKTVTVYDGEFPLCKFKTDTGLDLVRYSVEASDPLTYKCLSVLFNVLPRELFSSLYSDYTQRLIDGRVLDSASKQDPESSKDRSSEFGLLSSLFISLVKEGKNTEEKRAKVSYNDETREPVSPYESLLNSSFHIEKQKFTSKYFKSQFPSGPFLISEGLQIKYRTSSSLFIRHIFIIVEAFHLLYEDLKLDIFQHSLLHSLAGLIYSLARLMGRFGAEYIEYYSKAHPDLNDLNGVNQGTLEDFISKYLDVCPKAVPKIYDWILSLLKAQPPTFMPVLFERTRIVCRIFECFSEIPASSGPSPLAKRSPQHFVDTDIEISAKFPVFKPSFKEKKHKLRIPTNSKYNKVIQVLIEEKVKMEDIKSLPPGIALPVLQVIKSIQQTPPADSSSWPKKALTLINRLDLYHNKSLPKSKIQDKKFDQQYDQILQLELHHDEDISSSLSEYIFPKDLRMEEVSNILDVSKTLKMRMPENSISDEHFENEKHNLLYKLCLKRASTCIGYGAFTLGTSKASATSASSVPQINFSALLPPNFETKMQMSATELETREKDFMVWPKFHIGVATGLKMLSEDPKDYVRNRQWITYHRGEEESNEHAGFIMALGMLGQLEALHDLDIYRYLRAEQESIIIAIYLGTAASSLGSMDERIMRVLRISIAFLIPPFVDIEIKLTQEAASIMGFGLLYKCSGNRQVTEMLIVQLGRKALTNKDIEREGLSLAAGFALGMVSLAAGTVTPGLEDLRIDERLIRLFEGGKRMQPPKILQTGYLMGDSSKCSVTMEGDNFVTAITAPGALVAYALIHLRSNNELAADKIESPNTFYALEWIRPEHLMIKILSKNLILLDSVQGSKSWLFSQVPSLISFCFQSSLLQVYSKYPDKDIDFSTIANCYVYSLAGGFLSIAFKYLGTGDHSVSQVIIDEILLIREMKTQTMSHQDLSDTNKNSIEKQTLLTALCVGCLSLGLIMAGTGDSNSFRVMKKIRKRVEGEYGFSIAVNMAIGFLFLGNCQYSFSNSDFAIAAILAAIYPKFPSSPSDNRHHLQAFRHLYILALEKRLLVTKDADTKALVHVPVKVNYKDIGPVLATSPVLLRPLYLCSSIEVVDSEYFYCTAQLNELKKLVMFVKRKVENLDASKDWMWVKDDDLKIEELESWLGGSQTPDEFWQCQDRAMRVVDQLEIAGCKDKAVNEIWNAVLENRQEVLPFLWGIKEKKENLECVRLFYTKVLEERKWRSLISVEGLYELYR